MPSSRRLAQLRPEWLTTGGLRYQMGVEFDCPRHPPQGDTDHRLRLWFDNPCDGEEPVLAQLVLSELYPRLVHRSGFDLETLTLVPVRHDTGWPIDVTGHWRGYMVEGDVYDSEGFASRW